MNMISKLSFPVASLAASQVAAIPYLQRNGSDDSHGIDWTSCPAEVEEVATGPVQCANISVPLDYTDEDNGKTHTLELIKAPAEEQPALGSIIFNFGGPGGEGLVNLATSGVVYGP